MNVNEARDMLKKAAGVTKTYPISRALTSPKGVGLTAAAIIGGGLGAAGLAAGAPAALVVAPIAAALYGGLSYGVTRLQRFMHARALHSRAMRGAKKPFGITGSEVDAIAHILKSKLPKAAAYHPISEALTSRSFASLMNLVQLGVNPNPISAVGVLTAPVLAHIGRAVYSRALMGRLNTGKGLIPSEVKMVEALQGAAKAATKRRVTKMIAGGAAVAGGAAAGAYGVKKLVEQDAVA